MSLDCLGDYLAIAGHADNLYNGLYCREEDWNNLPHFENENGRHLYYYDSSYDYWQLDYREQDGTYDYYDGGYEYATTSDYTNPNAFDMW